MQKLIEVTKSRYATNLKCKIQHSSVILLKFVLAQFFVEFGKVDFICNELSFYNGYCKGIMIQVDLKTSTIKPLHANWDIYTHNLMSQRPEQIGSDFRKLRLLSDY